MCTNIFEAGCHTLPPHGPRAAPAHLEDCIHEGIKLCKEVEHLHSTIASIAGHVLQIAGCTVQHLLDLVDNI